MLKYFKTYVGVYSIGKVERQTEKSKFDLLCLLLKSHSDSEVKQWKWYFPTVCGVSGAYVGE